MRLLPFCVILVGLAAAGCKHTKPATPVKPVAVTVPAGTTTLVTNQARLTAPAPVPDRSEQIRSACIEGRRRICGRVLEVSEDGIVVESGYTELDREPLNRSWVVPGNVSAGMEPHAIEANVPGTYAYGLVYLTDLPKSSFRPTVVHKYDYVLLLGFPAGQYDYIPVPPVKKTIRKFTGTLEMAVVLNLQAEKQ